MEFLSREFDPENSIYPVSLVIQTPESKQAGYDASETGNYQRVNLTFDPTDDFHEYRFDYLPGRVLFYADSDLVGEMQGRGVPSVGGHLILAHWSNGNPNWSGGPPEMDALLTVSYVKSYFNSSDPKRLSERVEKCNAAGTSDGAVCAIPDGTAADAKTGGRFLGDDNGQEESGGEGEGKAGDDDEESSSRLSRDASITPVMLVAMVSMTMCFGPAWG